MAMHPKLYRQTTDDIKRVGRTVIGVFNAEPLPFLYTIGNYLRQGMPELLLVGLCDNDGMGLLNIASDLQNERGLRFADGELVNLGGAKFPVKFIDAGNAYTRDNFTIQAGQYWGHENYPVRQFLMCDTKGRFPGERGCAKPYSLQPLLNQRNN